jgi:hypothetical protein
LPHDGTGRTALSEAAIPIVPAVELKTIALIALLNPAVIGVAIWLGVTANQWQKLPVAAFAAACVGSLLIYLAVQLGLLSLARIGNAPAGIFIAQFLFGLVWAAAGYCCWRRRS